MVHEFQEDIPSPPPRSTTSCARRRTGPGSAAPSERSKTAGTAGMRSPLKHSPFPLIARITENDPERRVAWGFRGIWRGRGEVNFEPTDAGTLVTGFELISIPRMLGLGPMISATMDARRDPVHLVRVTCESTGPAQSSHEPHGESLPKWLPGIAPSVEDPTACSRSGTQGFTEPKTPQRPQKTWGRSCLLGVRRADRRLVRTGSDGPFGACHGIALIESFCSCRQVELLEPRR